jgi:cation transport ATPase
MRTVHPTHSLMSSFNLVPPGTLRSGGFGAVYGRSPLARVCLSILQLLVGAAMYPTFGCMFTLIAMGAGVAWLYPTVATIAPQLFPSAMKIMDGAGAVYFEAASVIAAIALLGQVLELCAREQTSGAIRALLDLAPKTARRIRHG